MSVAPSGISFSLHL